MVLHEQSFVEEFVSTNYVNNLDYISEASSDFTLFSGKSRFANCKVLKSL